MEKNLNLGHIGTIMEGVKGYVGNKKREIEKRSLPIEMNPFGISENTGYEKELYEFYNNSPVALDSGWPGMEEDPQGFIFNYIPPMLTFMSFCGTIYERLLNWMGTGILNGLHLSPIIIRSDGYSRVSLWPNHYFHDTKKGIDILDFAPIYDKGYETWVRPELTFDNANERFDLRFYPEILDIEMFEKLEEWKGKGLVVKDFLLRNGDCKDGKRNFDAIPYDVFFKTKQLEILKILERAKWIRFRSGGEDALNPIVMAEIVKREYYDNGQLKRIRSGVKDLVADKYYLNVEITDHEMNSNGVAEVDMLWVTL